MTKKPTQGAIDEVNRLFGAIGITPTLAKLGLAEDKLDWTAEQAVGIERLIKNNPRYFDLAAMKACSAPPMTATSPAQLHN